MTMSASGSRPIVSCSFVMVHCRAGGGFVCSSTRTFDCGATSQPPLPPPRRPLPRRVSRWCSASCVPPPGAVSYRQDVQSRRSALDMQCLHRRCARDVLGRVLHGSSTQTRGVDLVRVFFEDHGVRATGGGLARAASLAAVLLALGACSDPEPSSYTLTITSMDDSEICADGSGTEERCFPSDDLSLVDGTPAHLGDCVVVEVTGDGRTDVARAAWNGRCSPEAVRLGVTLWDGEPRVIIPECVGSLVSLRIEDETGATVWSVARETSTQHPLIRARDDRRGPARVRGTRCPDRATPGRRADRRRHPADRAARRRR